jgi:hypothetical protein
MNEVLISDENKGYDVSVYINGYKIKSAWNQFLSQAMITADELAYYYRGDNGQCSTIKYNIK